MRFTITLTAATDDRPTSGISIAVIERDDDTLTIDDLGLRIAESKRLLAALQLAVVQTQALDWCRRQRACPCCGSARQIKDHRSIMVRTPFGKIAVPSTRFRRCTCKPTAGIAAPIVAALPERVTPDLLELEARWASLASYGITAERLADVLPIGDAINATTIRQLHPMRRGAYGQIAEPLPGRLDNGEGIGFARRHSDRHHGHIHAARIAIRSRRSRHRRHTSDGGGRSGHRADCPSLDNVAKAERSTAFRSPLYAPPVKRACPATWLSFADIVTASAPLDMP
jgi:hypothetical protein